MDRAIRKRKAVSLKAEAEDGSKDEKKDEEPLLEDDLVEMISSEEEAEVVMVPDPRRPKGKLTEAELLAKKAEQEERKEKRRLELKAAKDAKSANRQTVACAAKGVPQIEALVGRLEKAVQAAEPFKDQILDVVMEAATGCLKDAQELLSKGHAVLKKAGAGKPVAKEDFNDETEKTLKDTLKHWANQCKGLQKATATEKANAKQEKKTAKAQAKGGA